MNEVETQYNSQIDQLNEKIKTLHADKNKQDMQLQNLLVEIGKQQSICDQESIKFKESQKKLSVIKTNTQELKQQLQIQRQIDQPNEQGIMKNSYISIAITEGKSLRTFDKFGKGDPYLIIEFEGQKLKTKVAKERMKAEFYQDFTLDVTYGKDNLCIRSFDYNQMGKDDLTGQGSVDLEQLRDQISHDITVTLTDAEMTGKDCGTVEMRLK